MTTMQKVKKAKKKKSKMKLSKMKILMVQALILMKKKSVEKNRKNLIKELKQ